MATAQTAPTIDIYDADDYAGLRVGDHDYYYGYEFGRTDDDEDVYGFIYKRDGHEVTRLPYGVMRRFSGCPDEFECQACLLFGIGLALAHGW